MKRLVESKCTLTFQPNLKPNKIRTEQPAALLKITYLLEFLQI